MKMSPVDAGNRRSSTPTKSHFLPFSSR